jgi:glutamate-1-semialdehyde 2,1-aminomutase
MKNYSKSKALYDRACQVMAGGVSSEFRKVAQPHPLFYSHGRGSHIVDVDGNDFLDFTLSQGPLILGHSHPHVLKTIQQHSEAGQLFAGQHIHELELAEKLQKLIPCAERMRFSLSGSEADHMGFRVARAFTGRPKFLRFEGHYHGWFDNVSISNAAPSLDAMGSRENPNKLPWTQGIAPSAQEELIVLPWNDLALLEKTVAERHKEIAAIITEPVMCNNGCIPPEPGFLEGIRGLCDKYGIVFILDEVITGFRLGLGGAQKYFNVTPDLAVFGKAMASGYPISVLVGKEKFMAGVAGSKVIHAGTMNSGNPSIAAALATIEVLEKETVHDRLFKFGQKLMEGIRAAAKETGQNVLVQGIGPMFHVGFTEAKKVKDLRDCFTYDKAKYADFSFRMQEKGIRLIGRGLWYISGAHTEAEIDQCITAVREVLKEMSSGGKEAGASIAAAGAKVAASK